MANKVFSIKHSDGTTDVLAKVESVLQQFYFTYKINGMTFSRVIPYKECISRELIECKHFSMQPIMGFDNVCTGEQCLDCGVILNN